jgi:hypothetical protein
MWLRGILIRISNFFGSYPKKKLPADFKKHEPLNPFFLFMIQFHGSDHFYHDNAYRGNKGELLPRGFNHRKGFNFQHFKAFFSTALRLKLCTQ